LMTSFATHEDVVRLAAKGSTEQVPVEAFPQPISLRLQPNGELFRDREGALSPYAPGHGDLPDALHRAGILERFVASGGELLFMSNVDNLTATLDPAIIGAHLAGGKPVTAEMAPKVPGDKGGAPARVDGVPQIVEAFRFPDDFDQDSIPVFNTNTLVFDARALARDFTLTWFAVNKTVEGLPAVQLERLVGELTAFLPSTFVRVEREGPDARFQPAKDPEELVRRQPEIRAALVARGVL
jgi:UTP--glucose-1-phosphate uridylyltransferase